TSDIENARSGSTRRPPSPTALSTTAPLGGASLGPRTVRWTSFPWRHSLASANGRAGARRLAARCTSTHASASASAYTASARRTARRVIARPPSPARLLCAGAMIHLPRAEPHELRGGEDHEVREREGGDEHEDERAAAADRTVNPRQIARRERERRD